LLGRLRRRPEAEPVEAPAREAGDRRVLEAALALKVLGAHLANRNQLMAAQPTDLQDLAAEQATLLIRAMGAAAHADGGYDARERDRIEAALATTALDEDARGALRSALDEPQCLETLARQVDGPEMATRFYAVSVAVLHRGPGTNRAYLDYLAHRLRLPGDVVLRLNRRFEVSV
jgi:uncharacterized membrane protein YebE (DUF533 family)